MHKTHYDTVSNALEKLRAQGFTTDFNLDENCISCEHGKFSADDFEVVDIYRYEGNTDPGDEAAVYAIQSKSGVKGTLVTGYGASGGISEELLKKLESQ